MNLSKALTGVYEDNPLNRKLGRVGRKYDHSSGHIVIDSVLLMLKGEIDDMVEKNVDALEEKQGREVTPSEAEYIRLHIISDMSIALSKYLKPSDKIIKAEKLFSPKGSIEVRLDIDRDGKKNYLETDMIYAGGYNIQQLHYRYLTKTSLPKIDNDTIKKVYKEKMSKLTKADKLLKEIDRADKTIKTWSDQIKKNKDKTDKQILEEDKGYQQYGKTTWEEIVKRGADKNYDYKEENFIVSQKEYEDDIINSFKRRNESLKSALVNLIKSKVKLESKLKSLL